ENILHVEENAEVLREVIARFPVPDRTRCLILHQRRVARTPVQMRAAISRLDPQIESIPAVTQSEIGTPGNESRDNDAFRLHIPIVSLGLQLGVIGIKPEALHPAGKEYQLLLITQFDSLNLGRPTVARSGQAI